MKTFLCSNIERFFINEHLRLWWMSFEKMGKGDFPKKLVNLSLWSSKGFLSVQDAGHLKMFVNNVDTFKDIKTFSAKNFFSVLSIFKSKSEGRLIDLCRSSTTYYFRSIFKLQKFFERITINKNVKTILNSQKNQTTKSLKNPNKIQFH